MNAERLAKRIVDCACAQQTSRPSAADRRIADEMDEFYDPQGFAKRRAKRLRIRRVLQSTFVGGIPFDDFRSDGRRA